MKNIGLKCQPNPILQYWSNSYLIIVKYGFVFNCLLLDEKPPKQTFVPAWNQSHISKTLQIHCFGNSVTVVCTFTSVLAIPVRPEKCSVDKVFHRSIGALCQCGF